MHRSPKPVVLALLASILITLFGVATPARAQQPQPAPPEVASELEVLMGRLQQLLIELQDLQQQLVAAQNGAPGLTGHLDARSYTSALTNHRARISRIEQRIAQILAELQQIQERLNEIRATTVPPTILPIKIEAQNKATTALNSALEIQTKTADAQIPVPPAGGKPVASKDVALSDSQKVKTAEIAKNFGNEAEKEWEESQGSATPSSDFTRKATQALSDYARIIAVPRPGEKEVRDLVGLVNQLDHKKLHQLTNQLRKLDKLTQQLTASLTNLSKASQLLTSGKPSGKVTWLTVNTKELTAKKHTGTFQNATEVLTMMKKNEKQIDQISDLRRKIVKAMQARTGQLSSSNKEIAKVMHAMLNATPEK